MTANISGKESAFDLLERTRKAVINKGRIAFAKALLETGEANADDSHKAFPDGFPDGINPVCLGAVTRPFVNAKAIGKKGYTLSQRQENHAREITIWQVLDLDAVEALYSQFVDEDSDIEQPVKQRGQGFLFDTSPDAARA